MPLNAVPAVKFSPSVSKEATTANYLGNADFNFLNQYLPETYNKEVERYSSQKITGFLERMGKEMPFSSDLVKWSEEGRLTQIATGATRVANVITSAGHTFRKDELVMISDATKQDQAIITAVTANDFTVAPIKTAGLTVGTTALTIWVYSNEFKKKTVGQDVSIVAQTEIFSNSPVIIKEMNREAGSDLAQITWIYCEGDFGSGYIWYFKNTNNAKIRFDNAIEAGLIEGQSYEAGSAAVTAGVKGTEGLFAATDLGNIFNGELTTKVDFENVCYRLDKQGAIQENMMFNSRSQGFKIDNMLASQNSYGAGGTSWGAFNNSEKMGLNLGFSDMRIGDSYEFYKSTWKYLTNPLGQGIYVGGSANRRHSLIVPSGSKTVHDEIMGKKETLPFLHVRYRKSEIEDRKYVVQVFGGAGGAATSSLDAKEVHFKTERLLCVMGRNNFVSVKD